MSMDPANKKALEAVGIFFLILVGLIVVIALAIAAFRWAAGF